MNGPFGGHFFMPFGAMPWMQREESVSPRSLEDFIPQRVQKAMDFVQLMTSKQQKHAAASEHTIEVIPGQELSDEEAAALATACNFLAKYFAGKVRPDQWEKTRMDHMKAKLKGNTTAGRLIHCPLCHPQNPNPNCIICKGGGAILATPASPIKGVPGPELPQMMMTGESGELNADGPPEETSDS